MAIKPTVGRVVWFYKYVAGQGHKGPMAAHVAFVNTDSHINLMVISENGVPHPEIGVFLRQGDDAIPVHDYCEWMPYQKGQAAKAEALEKQLGDQAERAR
jgi:hypothetical protein